MIIETLKAHSKMLIALRAGPLSTGSMTQKLAEEALRLVADKHEEWHLGDELGDFAAKVGRRVRVMLRDVQQALYKAKGKPIPAWLLGFVVSPSASMAPSSSSATPASMAPSSSSASGADPCGQAEVKDELQIDAEKTDVAPPTLAWFFGWDDDEQLAYRRPHDTPDSKPDWCKTVVSPKGATDPTAAHAEWKDGTTWAIPGYTCQDHLRAEAARAAMKHPEHWAGQHITDNSRIFVKDCTSKDKAYV